MRCLELRIIRNLINIIVPPTLFNNEVSNDQDHGVPREDVVPTELLLVPQ